MFKYFILVLLLIPSFSFAITTEELIVNLQNSPTELDPQTKEALIEYQIEHAAEILGGAGVLNFLGNLDPLTSKHLFGTSEISKNLYPTINNVISSASPSFTLNLFKGMEHPDVKKLQQFLNTNGFKVATAGPGSTGQESTYYGEATADAVRRFQEAYASTILKPNDLTRGNGQFLTATRAQANALKSAHTEGMHDMSTAGHASMPVAVTSPSFTLNLFKGMEHPDVKKLQQFLNTNGFKVATAGPGSTGQESTYYGEATADAVRRFQEAYASTILKPNDLTRGNGQFMTATRAQANALKSAPSTSGGGSSKSSKESVNTTTKNAAQTALREAARNTITVRVYGQGTVATADGQTCSTDTCVFVVDKNKEIVLKATAIENGEFLKWGSACRGTKNTCLIKMTSNKKVTATFSSLLGDHAEESGGSGGGSSSGGGGGGSTAPVAVTYLLTTAVSGSGTVSGDGINCPGDCTQTVNSGSSVTLTAVPGSGYTFAGWTGACAGTATCVVSMTTNKTASASFSPVVVTTAPAPAPTVAGGVDQPNPNPYNPDWEYCSDLYFGGCDFVGLRDIRYGNGTRWVTREYMDSFPGWECNPDVFGTTREDGDRCEVATERKTGTLEAPVGGMHSNMPEIDLAAIPLGFKGSGTLNIESTSDRGSTSDIGAFRIPCVYSHMAFNDPVVYPGQPGRSHLHTFFGNTAVNAYSTASSLASTGNSTCPGGIANRSSYWVPSMIDTATGKPVIPNGSLWYYKTAYGGVTPESVQVIPNGLRMIAASLPTQTTVPNEWEANYRWHCETAAGQHTNYGLTIPNCAAGDKVAAEIWFPQCWDGQNLDSADHRSHMAYPNGGCPSSHPVPLPELSLNISWKVETAGQAANFRLASDMNGNPAGVTMHADFFEAWLPSVKETFIQNCLNQSIDCHAYLLGNGTMLGQER